MLVATKPAPHWTRVLVLFPLAGPLEGCSLVPLLGVFDSTSKRLPVLHGGLCCPLRAKGATPQAKGCPSLYAHAALGCEWMSRGRRAGHGLELRALKVTVDKKLRRKAKQLSQPCSPETPALVHCVLPRSHEPSPF